MAKQTLASFIWFYLLTNWLTMLELCVNMSESERKEFSLCNSHLASLTWMQFYYVAKYLTLEVSQANFCSTQVTVMG